jgi:hypothetical protein
LCAVGENAKETRILEFEELDAEHVSTWSKGGGNPADNCRALHYP